VERHQCGIEVERNRGVRTLVRQIWLVGFVAQLKTPRQLPDVAVICKPYCKLNAVESC
jgi:hypothetical protein